MNKFNLPNKSNPIARLTGPIGEFILVLGAMAYVLLGTYEPYSLAVILVLVFAVSIAFRVLVFWDNEGFSPNRIQIGATWVLLGYDRSTSEFDTGPVRTYFVILMLGFLGLIVRPFFRFLILGINPEPAL